MSSIEQISKMQQRTGNIIDLPQLDDGELGFATDSGRLFIGNVAGNENVEVLTSYSSIDFGQLTQFSNTNPSDGQIISYSASKGWSLAGGNANSNINLGNVANVKIGGATNPGQILINDGLGNVFWGNAANVATTATPNAAGTQNTVQFNATGTLLGGDGNFTYIQATSTLNSPNIVASGKVTAGQLVSTANNITPPMVVNSTALVANLTSAFAGVANTVSISAQPNITSLGTLTNLTVSGNANSANVWVSNNATVANLTVTGNASVSNFSANATVNLGAVANVKITGGANGQVVATDGAGNLSFKNNLGYGWTDVANIGVNDLFTGYVADYVTPGSTFTANTSLPSSIAYWNADDVSPSGIIDVCYDVTTSQYWAITAGNRVITGNGTTWNNSAGQPSPGTFVKIMSEVGSKLILLTSNQIYYRNGSAWTSCNIQGLGTNTLTWVSYTNGRYIACGTVGIVYISTDGISWTLKNTGISSTPVVTYNGTPNIISCAISDAGVMAVNVIGVVNSVMTSLIYYSNDGNTWILGRNYYGHIGTNIYFIQGYFYFPIINDLYGGLCNVIPPTVTGLSTNTYYNLAVSFKVIKYINNNYFVFNDNTIAYGPSLTNLTPIVTSATGQITGLTGVSGNNPPTGGVLYAATTALGEVLSPPPTNQIYVETTEIPAPAGVYKCMGGVNPTLPLYLWARIS